MATTKRATRPVYRGPSRKAEAIVNRMPAWSVLSMGAAVATLPWLFVLLGVLVAWWLAGAILSVTLGQIIIWACFFAGGYAYARWR